MKTQTNICLSIAVLVLVFPGPIARAGEPPLNPTGTWIVSRPGTNAPTSASEQTLKLKLSGNSLTGTLTYNSSAVVKGKAHKAELTITEAKLEGGKITFNFTHPPASGNGPNAIYSYEGIISGDTIKGTVAMTWMDHTNTRTWQAIRLKQ